MKVLVLHNSYQQPGGEDAVVRMESSLLLSRGHTVHLHQVSNDQISGFLGKLGAAVGVVFAITSYREIRRLVRRVRPEVVHVHNFFPLLSPSVFYACSHERVPVVFTLHNYRIICPTALLMHDGVVTERSVREGPWWAIRKRVYKQSVVGTAALSAMIWVHRRIGTWTQRVSRFIALTDFAAAKFAEAGVPRSLIHTKPNFVDVQNSGDGERFGLLFVGRLSAEKGIETLASAARLLHGEYPPIKVVGGGPFAASLQEAPGLEPMGVLANEQVHVAMEQARALVIPSLCYEGFPIALAEAYGKGTPVIASRLGSLAEVVEDGVTGLLFEPGSAEDLAEKMRWAMEHPEQMAAMGRAARGCYEALYTADVCYANLMEAYRGAIDAELQKGSKGA